MPGLVAIARTGPAFVESLERVWERGDAVLPVDPAAPSATTTRLLEVMAPTSFIGTDGEERRRDGRPVEDGDALVVATSGSTGEPKGVVHTHASLAASAAMVSSALDVGPTDRWLCCLPLTHVAGLAIVVRSRLAGIGLEVHDRFDADAVMDAARRGATLTSLVPTTLHRVDPSSFRLVLVGGAAPPATLPANCRATYGLTETGSAIVLDGVVLDGAEVRIVDGEIQVRGDMLLRCYRDDTDPRDADGWFPTADSGEFAVDGRLVVHGRRGDVIVTGGEKVWPAPVEAVLASREDIVEVAVVGRPDDEWGAAVTAVVVATDPANPPTLDSLRDSVRAVLPVWCAPHRVEFVDALPRTRLGKVVRADL